jgi:hypothetical protein
VAGAFTVIWLRGSIVSTLSLQNYSVAIINIVAFLHVLAYYVS